MPPAVKFMKSANRPPITFVGGFVRLLTASDSKTAFVSAVLAIKIVAAHLYKTIDSYLDKHDAQIMDLIKWAKDEDKHQ